MPERLIAMKTLSSATDLENLDLIEARFRNEVMATYSVTHPNVVRTYDYIRKDDLIAFTMEYVVGGDLGDLLARNEEIPAHQIIHILYEICQGVSAIHEAGIIHRDLKPENILIGADGQIKISDFGTARLGATLSKKGGISGTVAYLSPEYLRDGQLDFRSDIYALGVVAYEMVTGTIPLQGDSLMETLNKRLNQPPEPPNYYNPNCPDSLNTLILKALETDPTLRYQTIEAMLNDLERMKQRAHLLADGIETEVFTAEQMQEYSDYVTQATQEPEITRSMTSLGSK